MGIFDLPTRSGWHIYIELKTKKINNKNWIGCDFSDKDFKTKQEVEAFVLEKYGITKEDCNRLEIDECCY